MDREIRISWLDVQHSMRYVKESEVREWFKGQHVPEDPEGFLRFVRANFDEIQKRSADGRRTYSTYFGMEEPYADYPLGAGTRIQENRRSTGAKRSPVKAKPKTKATAKKSPVKGRS